MISVGHITVNESEPTDQDIERWFAEARYEELERLVLDGKTNLIFKYSNKYLQMANFLENVQKNEQKLQQIFDAIQDGNLRKLKNLIDRKKLVLAKNKDGFTAIHLAVIMEHTPIVDYLAKTFPECVNLLDSAKRTPSHYAASLKDPSIYDILVSCGADLNAEDVDGRKPEFYKENPQELSKTLESCKIVDDNTSQSRYEVEYGDVEINKIKHTVPSPEQVQKWMDDGDIQQLERLVLDGRGHMVSERWSSHPDTEDFLNALPQYQSKIDAIHKSVEEGDVRRVKSLVDRTEMALAKNKWGLTPLHNAVLYGQTDTLRWLATKYPETCNAEDYNGRTPLHYAAAYSSNNVFVKILQKFGGDAFLEDKYGHTPFYYRSNPERLSALQKVKSEGVMEQLLAGGLMRSLLQELEEEIVDWLRAGNLGKLEELVLSGYGDLLLGKVAQVEDKEVLNFLEILPQYQAKIQAIHRSIEHGNLQKVKSLLDRKKLALARDRRGTTPLHKSVLFNRNDITVWLLKNYPQAINALDHNKRTPLHYAAALSSTDCGQAYKLLIKYGANPNLEDGSGKAAKFYLQHPNDLNMEMLRIENRGLNKYKVHQRVAPSYLESSIQTWMKEGNVQKLDQLVLSGCGDLLLERVCTNAAIQKFFEALPAYLDDISITHKAVREGDLKKLKDMVAANKKLVLARDRKGATPLHDALLYQQTDVVRFLVSAFPHIVNAADYSKRAPLHYAAAARDGGHYYKILEKAGADGTLTDKEGKTPVYYRRNPGKLDLRMILERDRDFVPDLPVMMHSEDELASRTESCMSDATLATPARSLDSSDKDNDDEPIPIIDIELSGSVAAVADVNEITTVSDNAHLGGGHSSPPPIPSSLSAIFNEDFLLQSQNVLDLSSAMNSPAEAPSNDDASPKVGSLQTSMWPSTENGQFLARTVGVPLTKALAEMVIVRPRDPVQFLADFLFDYDRKMRQAIE